MLGVPASTQTLNKSNSNSSLEELEQKTIKLREKLEKIRKN